ncbi:unnamed protein product [Cladocopium goreaui]|uniref:Uncharacterized protein n=1 Tax=Cladocopium goreaui TaxID=2562237 RepID=A0A9P1CQW1_9DINO|nr:unnamed protein product [Cladocopium goreaui]|mmetsp:Transcript_61698/g.135160  ORF Transcript_61698/g.135160 Transcript_61698/m.135160 type:complete len:273 (-) Transcript_61698:17-835(-)
MEQRKDGGALLKDRNILRKMWRLRRQEFIAILGFVTASWCFSCWGMPFPGNADAQRLLPQRRFFGSLLDPSSFQRETFVCETLDRWLPSPPPKSSMVALEIEPESSRYWPYLRPADCKWYMDRIYVVGELYGERLQKKEMQEMAATAEGMGASLRALAWRKAGIPSEVKPGSIDMGLMADGAFTALGPKKTEAALKRMYIMLKNSGRFYIVANEQDEKMALRGQLDIGFEPEVLLKLGWQIRASKRDHGLVVAYLTKRRRAKPAAKAKKSFD